MTARVRATELAVLRANGGLKKVLGPDHATNPSAIALVLLEHDADGAERVVAITNWCSHDGQPLIAGRRKDGWIECPFHAWRFDVCTGDRVLPDDLRAVYPKRAEDRIPTYAVEIDDQDIVWVHFPSEQSTIDQRARNMQ
jgi:nitrite reductase/ring-hydroxylating ferredoxin subunit